MFWADKITEGILKTYKTKIDSGEALIIRDEKTASGRVHVGAMRSVALHGIIDEILKERKIPHSFLYEINDFDSMDGLPVYLDQEKFKPYMGLPLFKVPSPDGKAKNYAEYFAEEFIEVINEAGFNPKFYRSSDMYKEGKYNECIEIALREAATIRKIYKDISGSLKNGDWLPLSVICEKCGKIGTTRVTSFDGKLVTYVCEEKMVEWATGCKHAGVISPFNGNAKFPWKVDWAAKFKIFNVDIEGAGKDHYTKGGAREVANTICREVFGHSSPYDIPHEFILVGGKKMSSSRGAGSSSREIADLLPSQIFRLFLIGKDIKKTTDFIPDGDTVPILFDTYDKYAEKYWEGIKDDETRAFELSHFEKTKDKLKARFLPRFSQIAFIIQMKHLDLKEEIEKMKGEPLNDDDIGELEERKKYALLWLSKYAPEDYKYELKETTPEKTSEFSNIQKEALKKILILIKETKNLDGGDLHAKLHEIRKESAIEPKDFFGSIYIAFLGKENGPKAGWFLSVLDKGFMEKRLTDITK